MATPASTDTGEDVSDFLRRIKEMGSQRDDEDAERTRKLEEEIMESRRQREARRAERARSLSPEKRSNPGTPRSTRSPSVMLRENRTDTPSNSSTITPDNRQRQESTEVEVPTTTSREQRLLEVQHIQPGPRIPHEASAKTSPSHVTPSRSATLSWQQRPTSMTGPRNRPLSMVERQTKPSPPDVTSKDDVGPELSRAEIAKQLGSKDVTFFKQTSDRGSISPAYRKTQVEQTDIVDHAQSNTSQGRQLHGLAHRSRNLDDFTKAARSQSPSDDNSAPATMKAVKPATSDPPSANAYSNPAFSLTPTNQFSPPVREGQAAGAQHNFDERARSPTRFSGRPASPTKGMGGFVSSAMLRSDSVSKRWSVQSAGNGLMRQDSIVRNRRLGRSDSKDEGAATNLISSGAISNVAGAHYGQGESAETISRSSPDHADSTSPGQRVSQQDLQNTSLARPASPPAARVSTTSTPSSPSKKWSPSKNKSSWLESALGKPDSPKPQAHSPVRSQPAWLADLNRTRQQRLSKDIPSGVVAEISPVSTSGNVADPFSSTTQADKREDGATNTPTTQVLKTKSKPAHLSDGLSTNEKAPPADVENIVPTNGNPEETRRTPSDFGPAVTDGVSLSRAEPSTPPKPNFKPQPRTMHAFHEKPTEEPEFRNALGRLKRAQTQNYKAPDVLKNNILAGKAALALTDGPQKTIQRDEFKESLLERKKTMKENVSDPNLLHKPKPSKETVEKPVPEAVARRRALTGGKQSASSQKPGAAAKDALPREDGDTAASSISIKTQSLATKPSGNKLADRFNPMLANLIARGPKSPAPAELEESTEHGRSDSTLAGAFNRTQSKEEPQPDGQLQHMTKTRAKGPKRRAPKGSNVATSNAPTMPKPNLLTVSMTDSKSAVQKEPVFSPSQSTPARERPTPPSSSRKVSMPVTSPPSNSAENESSKIEASPNLLSSGNSNDRFINPVVSDSKPISPVMHGNQQTNKSESSPSRPETAPTTKHARPKSISVKDATARWGGQLQEIKVQKPKSLQAPLAGLTTTSPQLPPEARSQDTKLQATADTSRQEPLKTKSKNVSATPTQQRIVSGSLKGLNEKSPNSHATSAEKVLLNFFGEVPKRPSKLEIDTATALTMPTAKRDKAITVRKDIVEISSDGKTVPRPPHEEHILYNESMYLCTHVFEDEKGDRTTEVYLWTGSEVSESATQDVQIFAKQTARETNGVLFTFRRGKETARFIQALGGILVTRNSKVAKEKPQAMLCGRRHLGHMVFDEVVFSLSSLTAAFPFIIQAQSAKTHLWKGLGCHAEEIGAARLIAMDIAATDEIVEVEQGKEAGDFVNMFPEPRQMPRSAEHWKHKPGQGNYQSRLFRISVGQGTSGGGQMNALWGAFRRQPSPANGAPTEAQQTRVDEVYPFAQSDLEEEHVYVLDAFFEIYVLPGVVSRSTASQSMFATALLFAQEYSILAASNEDRPFVPIGVVVMSGAPRDMKASFRAWDDGHLDSAALLGGSESGRWGPLKILGLASALAALKAD